MQREDLIYRTWPFLLITVSYITLAISLGKYYGEEDFHLIANQYHNRFFDIFFKYYTKTGEWMFGILVFVYTIWKSNYRSIFIFLTAAMLQFAVVQCIKRMFFADHWRPAYYFQQKGIDLHLVDGIQQGITYTFPSGHTATAFFVFFFLSILVKNRWIQVLCGFAAALAAYSRIYLSQHFVLDTAIGALLGVTLVVISYYFWNAVKIKFLDKKFAQN